MFSRRIQQRARHLVMLLIRPLAQLGVTPNTLTVIGLLLSIVTAVVIAQGLLLAGGLLVLFAGIFDMFDGAMARVSNAATTFGAFFDSTLDRYSESIILLGLLFYTLQRPGLHDAFWPFAYEQLWMITAIYIAMAGSLMVSYTKARAEGLGLECKTGLLARPERVIILALGLLSGLSIWAVTLLAIFSQITAIERIVYVWRITAQTVPTNVGAPQMETQVAQNEHNNHTYASDALVKVNTKDMNQSQQVSSTVGTKEVTEPAVLPMPTAIPPLNSGAQQE
jgi:CDP-diacylglycerol---glycerol-3-phosphate 3-phosphatidyltransferase